MEFESLEDRALLSVKFAFDYSLDTNGFFATQERRSLLSYAGLMITAQLNDTLSAITPSGSNTWKSTITHPGTGASKTISNKKLPTDVILVYAGGRNISQLGFGVSGGYSSSGSSAWRNNVKGRSESGALLSSPTDVAPKIGSITFDTAGPQWHFGKTTSGQSSGETDFISVAMHELGHVLGINNSASVNSWNRLISGGRFTGSKTRAENGGVNPPASGGHFAEGVKSDGIEVAMDPTLTTGTRKFYSELDFTALDDIGWGRSSSNDSIYRARHQLTHYVSTGPISVGDGVSFVGSIGASKDVDIYRVWGETGTVLSVSVSRASSAAPFDTYLRLFNTVGTGFKSADQGGSNGTDSLSYTLPRSDYYYIGISSYGNRNYSATRINSGPGGPTGNYRLGISMDDPPSRSSATLARDAVSRDPATVGPDVTRSSLEFTTQMINPSGLAPAASSPAIVEIDANNVQRVDVARDEFFKRLASDPAPPDELAGVTPSAKAAFTELAVFEAIAQSLVELQEGSLATF